MEMFEASSDVSGLSAEELVGSDAKEYGAGSGATMCIAQVEVVGTGLLERKEELLEAIEKERQREGYLFFALMVTDIVEQGTKLLCAGDCSGIERAFDAKQKDGVIDLPGVMSRKKQVAPRLIGAF